MQPPGPELRKFVAPEVIFGVGALHLAGRYGRNLGGSNALVVSDPGVLAAGWAQQVLASVEAAGLESTLFTQVTPNPRIDEAAAGARVYAEQGCDVIIAVGGGSAIDCAKCIGLLAANHGGLRALAGADNVGAPMPPTDMMLGSLEAGLAFSNASLGAVHTMAHGLGGLLDLPHGQCNAMLLEGVVDFNFAHAEQRYREAAAAMGFELGGIASGEIRKRLVVELRRLRETAGLGDTLSRCGVHRTDVHELAEIALNDPCVVTNPRRPCQRDIEVISAIPMLERKAEDLHPSPKGISNAR